MTRIFIDGLEMEVPAGISLKQALEMAGHRVSRFPGQGLFMPCQTGGCFACSLMVDEMPERACVTPVREGMRVRTGSMAAVFDGEAAGVGVKSGTGTGEPAPRRLVGGFSPHHVGGVGTPWWLQRSGGGFIEAACFAAGCNLRCPQCQNWQFTCLSQGQPLEPARAARLMTATGRRFGVDRLAISGGECTLNRPWLVQYLQALREMNPRARLHVDTNGSILTADYLDQLVQAGMTDVGIDLKGLRLETFLLISGLEDRDLARRYLDTAWAAAGYLLQEHPGVFLGLGIPYNRDLMEMEEVEEMGRRIAELDPWIQVCALDYRPEYQRMDLVRPSFGEMLQVHRVLRNSGLESVICQTSPGRIGPSGDLL